MMMNFVLLPFLLAANLVGNNPESWTHGPEYTFSVRISMISNLFRDNGRHMGSSVLCDMKCRPQDKDSLICRFDNARSTKITPRGMDPLETMPRKNATFATYGIGKAPFQIKFNERGIDRFIVEEDDYEVKPFVVNMYRMVANQLSIGVNLADISDTFHGMENFTTGECPTFFTVIRDESNETSKGFDLVPLNDVRIANDEVLRIVKKRDLSNCLPHKAYFFGTRYLYGIVLRDTIDKLISSASRIAISKHSFTSETVNILDVYDANRKLLGSVLDHLTLSLESIQPAETPLKPIPNPVPVEIVATTRCQRYL